MGEINIGKDLYLKGRIGWKGLSKDEYLEISDFRIINATALEDKFINWNKCGYISQERYAESPEIQLMEDDILISKDGTLGKIGFVKYLDKPSTVASGIFVLRNVRKDILDTDFLYHFLKSHFFKDFIYRNKAAGSTINHLYQRDLEKLSIELPALNAQIKISDLLNALDAKIELNQRINAELEQVAKTLYDYWVVQFEFPASFSPLGETGEGLGYKSAGGKMVWSEELKREIPLGWETKNLEDIENNIVTGKTPSTSNPEYYNGDIPFITIGDIRGNMHVVDTQIKLSETGAETQRNKFIPKGSLCVTCIASPGLIGFATKDSQTNQQINSIVIQNEENRTYLYFALNDYFKFSKGAKTGNTFANMNKGDFSSIKLVHPDKSLLLNFEKIAKPMVEEILIRQLESQTLTELRDWLLPMLMNGQVAVK